MKYKGRGNIREYIIEMSNLITKLKSLKLELDKDLIMHLVFISLPAHFGQFKDKCSLNELSLYLIMYKRKKGRREIKLKVLILLQLLRIRKVRTLRVLRKGLLKERNQRRTRNLPASTVRICSEVNLTFVPTNIWWVDSGVTTHTSVTMQGYLWSQPPSDDERFIFVDDGNKTFVVLSFRRNLISISNLDKFDFSCFFENNKVSLYQNSNVVSSGFGSLIDNLYMLENTTNWFILWHNLCVECIKGKGTNIRKLGAERAKDSFKAEVELQLGKKIKAIKSDCDGEYYDRYDGSGEQCLGLFALFLKECGIVTQYTMPGKPSMNGVVERRNWTLKDMVRRCQLKQLTKPLMNFGLAKSQASNICTFGLAVILLVILNALGYKFYHPTSRFFFETGNTRILEEVEFEKEENIRNIVFEEEFINDIGQVLMLVIVQETTPIIGDNVQIIVPDVVLKQDYDEVLPQTPIKQPYQPQEVSLKRSIRERRHAISDDYIVFLQEHEDGIGLTEDDPINFYQAMQSSKSQKWIDAMKDEMKSMQDNDIWDLVELPRGFIQKEGIDYKETFSLISSKDSFRTLMT
ncbi:hypothetical protein CR513_04830, partial [Mucuna pruriens]